MDYKKLQTENISLVDQKSIDLIVFHTNVHEGHHLNGWVGPVIKQKICVYDTYDVLETGEYIILHF